MPDLLSVDKYLVISPMATGFYFFFSWRDLETIWEKNKDEGKKKIRVAIVYLWKAGMEV